MRRTVLPKTFLAAFDKRVERVTCSVRFGIVDSVTGPYSSGRPLVELDDPAGTLAPMVNYSGQTLVVASKVLIVQQGLDQYIIGKHPDT